MRKLGCAILVFVLAGCEGTNERTDNGGGADPVPRGGVLTENGFASVLEAPYREFEIDLVETPLIRPSLEERRRTVQRRSQQKVEALFERLRVEEADNFGGGEWRWSEAGDVEKGQIGEPHFELLFVREPSRTLARYTDDPLFIAGEVGFTLDEREDVAKTWRQRFLDAGLKLDANPPGYPYFNILNTRSEFETIAEREDWSLPKGLEVSLRENFERPSVHEDAAPFVRIFPQALDFAGITPALATWGTIVLRDGCFFIDYEDRDDPLVQFPREAGLFVDEEGYLAIGPRTGDRSMAARVGSEAQLGYRYPVEASAVGDELIEQCGSHPIIGVTTVQHGVRFGINPSEIRQFRDRHNLGSEEAIEVFRQCFRNRAKALAGRRLRNSRDHLPTCDASALHPPEKKAEMRA